MRRRAMVLAGLIGVGLLVGAMVFVGSRLVFRSHSVVTEGVVVGRQASTGTGDLTYRFRIEWTLSGERHRFLTAVASPSTTYDMGETVTVCYPPTNPDEARLWSFEEDLLGPLVFSLIGLGMLAASAKLRRPAGAAPRSPGVVGSTGGG